MPVWKKLLRIQSGLRSPSLFFFPIWKQCPCLTHQWLRLRQSWAEVQSAAVAFGQIEINKVEVCFSPIFRNPELMQIIMDVFDYLRSSSTFCSPRLALQDLEICTVCPLGCVTCISFGVTLPLGLRFFRNKIDSLSLKESESFRSQSSCDLGAVRFEIQMASWLAGNSMQS